MSFHVSGNMTTGELTTSLEKLETRLDTLESTLQGLSEEVQKLPEALSQVLIEALREYQNQR